MRGMLFASLLDCFNVWFRNYGSGTALLVCLGLPVGRDITSSLFGLAVGFQCCCTC